MGLRGKLAGKDGNRVKAIKLRGVLSQGIVYPAREGWVEGQDVAALLGVHKWEPPAPPAHMNGVCYAAGLDRCMRYDIENFKAYPEVLVPGEPVVFTEKIHGTWCQVGYLPPAMIDSEGHLVVSSKGLAAKGLAFRPDAPENAGNLYLRVARGLEIDRRISEVFVAELAEGHPIFVLGEVFGAGVQDLAYGAKADAQGTLGLSGVRYLRRAPGAGRVPQRPAAVGRVRAAGAAARAGAVPRAVWPRGDARAHGRQGDGHRQGAAYPRGHRRARGGRAA